MYKQLSIRALYFELIIFFYNDYYSYSSLFVLAGKIDKHLNQSLDWNNQKIQLDPFLYLDIKLTEAIYYFSQPSQVDDGIDCFYEAIEMNINWPFDLKQKLISLETELPNFDEFKNRDDWLEEFRYWWFCTGDRWLQDLQEILMKYCDIGYNWDFSEEQQILISDYYYANDLILECLQTDCRLNYKVRQEIEDTLFLPIAEIEKRKK